MRRRDFISLAGGAIAWPLAAHAQQGERMRRIGVLMNTAGDDPDSQAQLAAFEQGMQQLGWTGRNLQIDIRWGAGSLDRTVQYATELVRLSPEVILVAGGPAVTTIQAASRNIPIVFSQSIDPVGAGFVQSLARPGGNATGFMQFEYGLAAKWPEILREIAPKVRRAAVLRDPTNSAGIGQWAVMQVTASALGMELSPLNVHDAGDIAATINALPPGPDVGLIVPVSAVAVVNRAVIVSEVARRRLPAIYPYRLYVSEGGLVSYGPDLLDQYRRAAGYVDRILKGEKPGDLPVQAPTKYETVLNLKTAKALGLDVPASVLARADEVIE